MGALTIAVRMAGRAGRSPSAACPAGSAAGRRFQRCRLALSALSSPLVPVGWSVGRSACASNASGGVPGSARVAVTEGRTRASRRPARPSTEAEKERGVRLDDAMVPDDLLVLGARHAHERWKHRRRLRVAVCQRRATALAAPGQWRWLRLQWGPQPRPRGRPMSTKREAWANMPTDVDDSGHGASVTIKRWAV